MSENTRKTLDHIIRDPQDADSHNPKYSKFIRLAQRIMPIVAVLLVAMVFLWNAIERDVIIPLEEGTLTVEALGKNELINPRFESRDDKNQPYTITASRAYQEKTNEDHIALDDPSGEVSLSSGEHVAIGATRGDFSQETQELILRDQVKLAHSNGYTLDTEILYMNLKAGQSGTDAKVFVESQEGTIESIGMRAYQDEEVIQFIGPAKMILKDGLPGGFP